MEKASKERLRMSRKSKDRWKVVERGRKDIYGKEAQSRRETAGVRNRNNKNIIDRPYPEGKRRGYWLFMTHLTLPITDTPGSPIP